MPPLGPPSLPPPPGPSPGVPPEVLQALLQAAARPPGDTHIHLPDGGRRIIRGDNGEAVGSVPWDGQQ